MVTQPQRPTVEVVQLVRVTYLFGKGVEHDPARIITAYYDLTGELVFEVDHWKFNKRVQAELSA